MSNIPVYSVTELSNSIKDSLERKYERVKVRGEITGYKNWNGHLLFNLKDESSLLSCRIWKNRVSYLEFFPEDGLEIISVGKISTHMQRSNYNFIIEDIQLAGEGELLKIIERRKDKFKKLGYFDDNKKKKIPFLPKIIGIVTSLSGAVIEDIKKTISERFPSHLILWPASVQGPKSENQLSNAINGFNRLRKKPDVIIIARGGGSIEDLMPFNSERVIEAIYQSSIPIVSAVGHETDHTLADLVADKRASTPTNAADITVPDLKILSESLVSLEYALKNNIQSNIKKNFYRYEAVKSKITHPKKIIDILKYNYVNNFQIVEERVSSLIFNYNSILSKTFLKKPRRYIENREKILKKLEKSYFNAISKFLIFKKKSLENYIKILETSSYQRLLEKGFVLLKNDKNELVKTINKVKVNDNLNIQFLKGKIFANVKKIEK